MTQPQWTDRAVDKSSQDTLSFEHYCRVLTDIVTEADTPLTIGIFGPWGSGKTSLMRLIQEALGNLPQPPITVWFNAWKYDQEEALWRAMVIQVLNAFRPERPSDEPFSQDKLELSQRLDDLESSLYHTVEREEAGEVTIDWEKLLKGSIMGLTHLSLSALPGIGTVLGHMMEKTQEKITGDDLNTIFDAIRRERHKTYREHVRSLEQFQHKFCQLVEDEVLAKNRRLVVFIDDLDRCLPEKAIAVLEALKLFLDVPGCVFFLGADREVIQRGIRVKYKSFLVDSDDPVTAYRRIPITGDNFLEKIIQLPFQLLPLDEERVEQFINEVGISLPEGCADIFAAGLEANPRKVKRTLNIFRMLHKLASVRQKKFKVNGQSVEINPQLLAKVVVIQSRFPDLYNDLVEYPALLPDLEQYFAEKFNAVTPDNMQPSFDPADEAGQQSDAIHSKFEDYSLLDKYQHRRPLQLLLSRGARFTDLPLREVKLYLYLTYTADETGQKNAAENMANRWWMQLLSNDLTKIKSTVAAIQDDSREVVVDFQHRLVVLIERSDQPQDLPKHLSAGIALALLGDPRNLDEMIPIPQGEYLVGDDNTPYPIEGFNISKYLVTNMQYKKFLEENPRHAPPTHWSRSNYPPELANHPVTNVSWEDAQAYCRWAGKYLPSAQQWEAAARGLTKENTHHEMQSEMANVAEMNLNGTSSVGVFPGGASPFGVLDIVGNVWEWTQTPEGDGYILKGGAWNASITEVTYAGKRYDSLDAKSPSIGFRVAE